MSSVAFLSLCLVVLLADLNQVKCDGDMSLVDEKVERMKRDAAIELYDRLKRQVGTTTTTKRGSVELLIGKDDKYPWARLLVDHKFGRNGRHQVGGNFDYSKDSGFGGGIGADFTWNDGRTRLIPQVTFNRKGVSGAAIRFTHQWGKKR